MTPISEQETINSRGQKGMLQVRSAFEKYCFKNEQKKRKRHKVHWSEGAPHHVIVKSIVKCEILLEILHCLHCSFPLAKKKCKIPFSSWTLFTDLRILQRIVPNSGLPGIHPWNQWMLQTETRMRLKTETPVIKEVIWDAIDLKACNKWRARREVSCPPKAILLKMVIQTLLQMLMNFTFKQVSFYVIAMKQMELTCMKQCCEHLWFKWEAPSNDKWLGQKDIQWGIHSLGLICKNLWASPLLVFTQMRQKYTNTI